MTERQWLAAVLSGRFDDCPPDELLRFARRHHLLPLWFHQRTGLADLPEARQAYLEQWRRNHLMLRALDEIFEQLEEAGIDWMLLKGLPLAQQLFGDLGARAVGDADILVRPRDFPRALELLTGVGFDCPAAWLGRLGPALGFVHALSMRRGDLNLDLHHHFRCDPCLRLDGDGIWSRLKRFELHDREIPVPDDLDTFVLLVLGLHDDLGQGAARVRSLLDLQAAWRLWGGIAFERRCREHAVLKMAANVLHLVGGLGPVGSADLLIPAPPDFLFRASRWSRRLWALRLYDVGLARATACWLSGLVFRTLAHRL